MISIRDINNSVSVLQHMVDALVTGSIAAPGRPGFDLRHVVGDLMANAPVLVQAGTFGTKLQDCFNKALLAGATLDTMDRVRIAMVAENPVNAVGTRIKVAGIMLSLAGQGKIISAMEFFSRSDVEALMQRMSTVIDDIKLDVSELLNGVNYLSVVTLSAAIIQHLAITERQLPRIVSYRMDTNYPSLTLANRLYSDADRGEELTEENKVIHPAFFPLDIVALSR